MISGKCAYFNMYLGNIDERNCTSSSHFVCPEKQYRSENTTNCKYFFLQLMMLTFYQVFERLEIFFFYFRSCKISFKEPIYKITLIVTVIRVLVKGE